VSYNDQSCSSWFEIVELPVLERPDVSTAKDKKGHKGNKAFDKDPYFDKSSAMIAKLVYATWFCRYPRCRNIIYDNGSEFKLHFLQSLCDSFGLKCKPTSVKNPQANAILEHIHQTLVNMMRTAELDMAESADPGDVADFLNEYLKPLQAQQFLVGHVVRCTLPS
jgi:hypothetical protein